MKKTILAVLMTLVMGLALVGCSSESPSASSKKLEKWQEAEIVSDVISALEIKFSKEKLKVVKRDDIEVQRHFFVEDLDGSKAIHWYFGWVPVNVKSSEKKVNTFFIAIFSEYIIDTPNPMSVSGEMIKKGTVKKNKVHFLGVIPIDDKEMDKYKLNWVEKMRKDLAEEWGSRVREELM